MLPLGVPLHLWKHERHQPHQQGDDEHQHAPPHRGRQQGKVEGRQRRLKPKLHQLFAALGHPVPGRVGHHSRQQDRPRPFGDAESEEHRQPRYEQDDDQELAKLDADVERQERGQQMTSRKLKRLTQGKRKAESVDEAEREGNEPPLPEPNPRMFSIAM